MNTRSAHSYVSNFELPLTGSVYWSIFRPKYILGENMKRISVANDIVPIGEFKSGLSKWIKKSKSSGNPIVITQNGRPAAVVISPTDYDQLNELRQFVDSVKRGLSDSDKGNIFTTNEVHAELEKRRLPRSIK